MTRRRAVLSVSSAVLLVCVGVLSVAWVRGRRDSDTEQRGEGVAVSESTSPPHAGPFGSARLDEFDYVHLSGIYYYRAGRAQITPSELEHRIGVIGDGTGSDPTSGEASILPPGTTVWSLSRSVPPLRVAVARPDGHVDVYEALYIDGATTGEQLIDVRSEVGGIWIVDGVDHHRVAAIDVDPDVLDTLLQDLATAPVVSGRTLDSEASRWALELVMSVGPSTIRSVWPDQRLLQPGIELTERWVATIDEAVRNAPAPVPGADPGGGTVGPLIFQQQADTGDLGDALKPGTLVIEGGCASIAAYGWTNPVLWPYGTQWNAETQSVVLPGGMVLAIGDDVELGGGAVYVDDIGRLVTSELGVRAVEECARLNATSEVYVVS